MADSSGDLYILGQDFLWLLLSFPDIPQDVNYVVQSRPFPFDESTWCLRMYPNGRSPGIEGRLHLTLLRISPVDRQQIIRYRLGVMESLELAYEHFGEVRIFEAGRLEHGKALSLNRSDLELEASSAGEVLVRVTLMRADE